MEYINNYTYEKHLKAKEIKEKTEENVVCEDVQAVKEQSADVKIASERRSIENNIDNQSRKNLVVCVRDYALKLIKMLLKAFGSA